MANCKQCNSSGGVIPTVGFCATCLQDIMANASKNEAEKQPQHGDDSGWQLVGPSGKKELRKVQVEPNLKEVLKPYQVEGVDFLWRNSFSDLNHCEMGDQSKIGGCILAHYMGLGKSLTTITLLHTALTFPSMVSSGNKRPLLHSVLLIAPVNTLTNWVNEVEKWTNSLGEPLKILNLGEIMPSTRAKNIRKWKREGGVLVMGDALFLKMADLIVDAAQPDVLVLDEAHTMLKSSANKGFKRLQEIQTKRRILLTGTPLQNNVTEYYRMVEFIRPGVVGVESEAEFETMYRFPIEAGLPSDASDKDKLVSLQLQLDLRTKLEPYVNRKSANVLRKLLPPIYDNLLYLRSSPIQDRLMKLEVRARKKGDKSRNFFSMYSTLHPLLNHPGCLKLSKGKKGKEWTWKSLDEAEDEWYMEAGLEDKEFDSMHEAKNSPKLIILAHIIAFALLYGDKTLIYSDNLATLGIIEWFFSQDDWRRHANSLGHYDPFKNLKLGGWKKNKDYVRIDGGVDSGKRGCLVDTFNDQKDIKAFLISSKAGGIGINLCSASVVVMMDNHFNPSISDQCISRAHRLGQTKPVYSFRLAIEGTTEAKIYARSVNKSGVAMQVVDGKFSERQFSADQLNDLCATSIIATCERCTRRRLLPDSQDPPDEGQEWHCGMNQDANHNSCDVPEQRELQKQDKEQKYLDNNAILQHLRKVVNHKTRRSEIVQDFLPVEVVHEADICCEDAIDRLEAHMEGKEPRKVEKRVPSSEKKAKHKAPAVQRAGAVEDPIEIDVSSESDSETDVNKRRRLSS